MTTLKAEKRDTGIKAKKLRREGSVPGNLCGKDLETSTPVKMNILEVQRFVKKNNIGSRVVLDVDGKQINAIVKDIEYNSILKKIMFVDFQTLVAGEKISAKAQIIILNENLANGCVDEELSEVSYKADPENLIEKVEVDFAKYGNTRCIRVKDIPEFNTGKIDLITSPDATVLSVGDASAPIEEPVNLDKEVAPDAVAPVA